MGPTQTVNVTVWNEGRHEQRDPEVARVYPDGIHGAIAGALNREPGILARTATLDDPEHGLSADVLEATDVLLWWGHIAHEEVADSVVDRVQARILAGMGLIVLHSGHYSKIFRRLMGTHCSLTWRESGQRERVWNVSPTHPIAAGVGPWFDIPQTEMYGEFFDIPDPDELVFISWHEGGEVFRGGCCFHRGFGKVFYFAPGHETYPIYYQGEVQRVLANAVQWAAPAPLVGFRDLSTAPESR